MRVPAAGVGAILRGYQSWLRGQQQRLEAQYDLATCDWEISQESGLITYRRAGHVVMRATYAMLGSYCADNGTWLWAWANTSIKREYAIAPQQTVQCAQHVGVLGLAQPLVALHDWSILWQDCVPQATAAMLTETAVRRLVSMAAYGTNAIGVQYYLNKTHKTMGWVMLRYVYRPVESV